MSAELKAKWYRLELSVCVDPSRLKDEVDVAEVVGDLLGAEGAEKLGLLDRTEPVAEEEEEEERGRRR